MRFLSDENFNGNVLEELRRLLPDIDLVRVQDVGLYGIDDPTILEWAAEQKRVVLTHDIKTMTYYANQRIVNGLPMWGVWAIHTQESVGRMLEVLLLHIGASFEGEYENHVEYITNTIK